MRNLTNSNVPESKFKFKNEIFEDKFKNLFKTQSESEKQSAVKEFYLIYMQGFKPTEKYSQRDFINLFIEFIRLCSINYKETEAIWIDSRKYFINLNTLFITIGWFILDGLEKDSKIPDRYFYDKNMNPVFTSDGLVIKYQEWINNGKEMERKKYSMTTVCVINKFSKYLIFDARENLNFFFNYFKNDDFTVKFSYKTYEFIGFVLDNENYDHFEVSDKIVLFNENENTVIMSWSQFKVEYDEKYGSINVIVILKKLN